MGLFFLPPQSLRRKAARFHANGVWGSSGGRGGGGECGAAAVGGGGAGAGQPGTADAGGQVAGHADAAVEGRVDEGARVEAMRGEWMFGMALRAVARAMRIGVSKLLGVLLDRAGEWV